MLVILILMSLSLGGLKETIKKRFGVLVLVRDKIETYLHAQIVFSDVQNLLHIPFFAALAFLWMKFFGRRKISLRKAAFFTLIIVCCFSLLSEFLQIAHPSRDASLGDLFFDVSGFSSLKGCDETDA